MQYGKKDVRSTRSDRKRLSQEMRADSPLPAARLGALGRVMILATGCQPTNLSISGEVRASGLWHTRANSEGLHATLKRDAAASRFGALMVPLGGVRRRRNEEVEHRFSEERSHWIVFYRKQSCMIFSLTRDHDDIVSLRYYTHAHKTPAPPLL